MKSLLLVLSILFSSVVSAAPKSELWGFWDARDDQNPQTISHQKWQDFLDNNLVEEGENTLVAYGKVSNADKESLNAYISDLTNIDPREYSNPEQYAYWVNLYNALTVDLILENYPIKSITKLGGLFSFGPWGDEIARVAGKTLTLNDIEHRILRPIWNDPRTHYAVNCASLGCPNLQPLAFTASNQEMLLAQAAGSFINSRKGVSITGNKGELSSIYDWFIDDFGGQEGLKEHLLKYRPSLTVDLKKVTFDYDWSLNEQK
jgi:hypothetical protein